MIAVKKPIRVITTQIIDLEGPDFTSGIKALSKGLSK
jgi:hypothetical protein